MRHMSPADPESCRIIEKKKIMEILSYTGIRLKFFTYHFVSSLIKSYRFDHRNKTIR